MFCLCQETLILRGKTGSPKGELLQGNNGEGWHFEVFTKLTLLNVYVSKSYNTEEEAEEAIEKDKPCEPSIGYTPGDKNSTYDDVYEILDLSKEHMVFSQD